MEVPLPVRPARCRYIITYVPTGLAPRGTACRHSRVHACLQVGAGAPGVPAGGNGDLAGTKPPRCPTVLLAGQLHGDGQRAALWFLLCC